MKPRGLLLFVGSLVATLSTPLARADTYRVASPNEAVVVEVVSDEAELSYTLLWQNETVLERSSISLMSDAKHKVLSAEQTEVDQTWEPVWGQFSEIRDHYRELTLRISVEEVEATLHVRVFDEGVGFRFRLPEQEGTAKLPVKFHTEFNLPEDVAGYYPQGESEPRGPERLSEWRAQTSDPELDATAQARARHRAMPGLFERSDGSYFALLESDLFSAELFDASRLQINRERLGTSVTATATADGTAVVTPWRVVLLGKTPGDLIVNQIPLNLAAPCAIDDPSWITPGKGLWDWRIHGYDNGDFVYGIDTRSYLRLIDFAAEQGLDYLTIDDHWFTEAAPGEMKVAPEVDIERVMKYAKEKGIAVILYYDRHKGEYGDEALFPFYRGLGASGMKYGFMGNNAPFTRSAIRGAAASELVIFFHDAPVPMTGVHRTMPNMVTREYCHAQQDSRRAFTPRSFLKMAMINALSGPLDQANGNFGIKSINAGERQKGPRRLNSYVSTVTSEVARTLVIFSGLITLPDAPEEYRKKADLFEFLKQMPATWDETRVLHSEMEEYITTARRSGDTWFVGSVNNETKRELVIELDFLTPGKTYDVTLFEDAPDAHGLNNPEAYQIRTARLQADAAVTARMAVGGGHAMILTPAE